MFCLALLAVMAFVVVPAGAEVFRFEEGGKPALTGDLAGEGAHGVIHCPAVSQLFGGGTGSASAGAIVVKPNEEWQLASPAGGECEAIFLALHG
jgi:hypothetical protein